MKPVCANCRHFQEGRLSFPALCLHPDAASIDRVRGPVYPMVEDWFTGNTTTAIADCDRKKRFEPNPWWAFWRLLG